MVQATEAAISNNNEELYSVIPSPSDGEAIQAKLAEKFKSGQILLEDNDYLRYLVVFFIFVVFFWLNSKFWWKLMEYYKIKQFMQRGPQDKVYFNATVAGQVHHLLVATFSFYLLYNSCQNENGYVFPSENGGSYTSSGNHFGWLHDEVCMMEVSKGYVYNVLLSCAWMSVDLYILKTSIENPSVLNRQTIWHHYMAIGGFSISLIAGYGLPGLSSASLICEYSSIFLSYKDMFTKDTRNTFWGIFVQAMFFITYTIFRFIWFPFLAYRSITLAILAFNLVGPFRKFCLIYCAFQAQLVLLLNLYWYTLILKGLKRLLETVGVLKKPEGDNQYDDVDKYEANANTELQAQNEDQHEGGRIQCVHDDNDDN